MNPSQTAIPRAVLDSNVIFSRVLHEFLGRLALEARLLDIVYSDGALLAHGIRVVEPDAVLASAYDEQPDLLLAILERQAAAWGDRSPSELLDALDRAGVPGFARNARAARSPG